MIAFCSQMIILSLKDVVKGFYTKITWFKFSLINPKGLPGALCIKLRSVYDTMLYHHSITQKNVSEKATEESPRVLPLKIIIQTFSIETVTMTTYIR